MKVGDYIIITNIMSSVYVDLNIGQKYRIKKINRTCFEIDVDNICNIFFKDNKHNNACKYRLVSRELKLKRILNGK